MSLNPLDVSFTTSQNESVIINELGLITQYTIEDTGLVYIFGGYDHDIPTNVDTVYVYDIDNDIAYESTVTIPQNYRVSAGVFAFDRLWYIGGASDSPSPGTGVDTMYLLGPRIFF